MAKKKAKTDNPNPKPRELSEEEAREFYKRKEGETQADFELRVLHGRRLGLIVGPRPIGHPPPFDIPRIPSPTAEQVAAFPASLDLRAYDPPIFNQGSVGSCASNAACGAFQWLQNYLNPPASFAGARLAMYKWGRDYDGVTDDCVNAAPYCDTGLSMETVVAIATNMGVAHESLWPYCGLDESAQTCPNFNTEPPANVVADAANAKATQTSIISTGWDETFGGFINTSVNDIKAALNTPRPVFFGFPVYSNYETGLIDIDGRIPSPFGGGAFFIGYHANVFVGYDDNFVNWDQTKGAFIVRNSWGTDWALNGYAWMPYNFASGGLNLIFDACVFNSETVAGGGTNATWTQTVTPGCTTIAYAPTVVIGKASATSNVVSITITQPGYGPATSEVRVITVLPIAPTIKATALTAFSSEPSPFTNQDFTISGTLTAMGAPVPGQLITLQASFDNVTWNAITTTTTDANGGYVFTESEVASGDYYFFTTYAGNAKYLGSESSLITISVIYEVTQPIPDYVFEVRQKNASGGFDLKGVLSDRILPSYKRELGMADQLTFNLRITDPNYAIFTDNFANLEVWYYGRDYALKQVFVPQYVEPYRDYGGTSAGSGSGALGSGSGDMVLITCDGPETYLSRYYTENYKISQRAPSDILNDITLEARQDGVLNRCIVDPALNAKLLDVDLSWENLQTAVNNIIAQTGGYMQVKVEAANPAKRDLYLMPIPGQLPQPVDTGASSPVLPQARRELLAREGIEAPTREEILAAKPSQPQPQMQLRRVKNAKKV